MLLGERERTKDPVVKHIRSSAITDNIGFIYKRLHM